MTYSKVKQVWIRWTTWEYLPMWLSNLPVAMFYLWYAAKARRLFFFSAANPAIPLGGAMGISKYDSLERVPAAIRPKMAFVKADMEFEQVLIVIQSAGLTFPVIAKPDIGERGFLVKKIDHSDALRQYLMQYRIDFILQEFISLPVEAGVLFNLFPGDTGRFDITSVCIKEFLQIKGDGRRSLRELILQNARAAFQLERIELEYPDQMEQVLPAGQIFPLGHIGNHCLGAKFLNGNHLIDHQFIHSFEGICRQMKGIHYGRFDVKCASLEDLKNGKVQVLELNGVLGEPAHVYDPSVGPWRAYRDFLRHWGLIFELSKANRKMGASVATFKEGWLHVQKYLAYKKQFG